MRLTRAVSITIFFSLLAMPAFAKMYERPRSFSMRDQRLTEINRKVMPPIDVRSLLAEDEEREKRRKGPEPERFAISIDANFTPDNAGTWQTLSDGRLWRLRIQSPGAVSQNLGITRFQMPDGAKLWIYDPAARHVEGPYTARHKTPNGLWTPIIEGEEMVVELFVPKGAAKPLITISKVNQGYRGLGKTGLFGGSEGTCEIDVVCPQGAPWANTIRAVGVYTRNGTAGCTGTLLNNTALDFKPYVFTADHCGVSAANAGTVVIYWNFQSAACGTHGPGSTADNQTGATFRATNKATDFGLFELNAMPDPSFNVFYAGWDASGVAPASTVSIHHPALDVKAITFSNTPATPAPNPLPGSGPANTHWRADWSSGVTEKGSSGSCLFDAATQRCIGDLTDGPSFCGATPANLHDFYGQFSQSWTGGGTAATRLSDWLDPGNTGVTGLDGDPHITTTDGVHYDFQGAGEYVALRESDGLEIQTRMTPIATTFNPGPDPHDKLATCVSLNSAVAALVDKHRVTIQPNLSGVPDPSGLQVRIDGTLTNVGAGGVNVGAGRIARAPVGSGYIVDFPNGTALAVTPLFWQSQQKWYLNVDLFRGGAADGMNGIGATAPARGGIMGPIVPGSWLPALPDGTSMGAMPATLNQRYNALYKKFGEAWRVTERTSLFDYAPGTSTSTFTMPEWPLAQPPCKIPHATPAKPLDRATAVVACREVRDRKRQANCVFDVVVTGEKGFAELYLLTQRLRAGMTTTVLRDAKEILTVTVAARSAADRVPQGDVELRVDGDAQQRIRLDANGRAQLRKASLRPGRHVVNATYIPTENGFIASSSIEKIIVVEDR